MIIFDERLSDIIEDGNARRGWFMDLKRQEADEYSHIEQIVEAMKEFELPYVAA